MVSCEEIPVASFLSDKPDASLARAGVYAIFCDNNGMYYIGSSANIRTRIRHHFNSLVSGKHHNPRMQHAFSKYGPKRFIFSALEFTDRNTDVLVGCERKWIQCLNSVDSGFNVMPAANCPLGVIRKNKENFKSAAKARSEDPHSNQNRKYRFISPSGLLIEGFNVARFCRDRGFGKGATTNFQNLARGHIGSYNGWTSPDSKPTGERRGLPNAYSLTDSNGVVHEGVNISEFCRSLGVRKGFFQSLIRGNPVKSGWTITPGFIFSKRKIEHTLISPCGIENRFHSAKEFSEKNGLNHRCVKAFLSSNAVKYRGWTKTKC